MFRLHGSGLHCCCRHCELTPCLSISIILLWRKNADEESTKPEVLIHGIDVEVVDFLPFIFRDQTLKVNLKLYRPMVHLKQSLEDANHNWDIGVPLTNFDPVVSRYSRPVSNSSGTLSLPLAHQHVVSLLLHRFLKSRHERISRVLNNDVVRPGRVELRDGIVLMTPSGHTEFGPGRLTQTAKDVRGVIDFNKMNINGAFEGELINDGGKITLSGSSDLDSFMYVFEIIKLPTFFRQSSFFPVSPFFDSKQSLA